MDKFVLPIGSSYSITFAALPARHFWRTHEVSVVTPPTPPEGYTIAQALENLPQFKQQMEDYDSSARMQNMMRACGASRLVALDQLPEVKEESDKLRHLCTRYTYNHPDLFEDPLDVGAAITEIISEQCPRGIMSEIYLWLQEKAGAINHAEVEEVLKRIRDDRERNADPESRADDPGRAAVGEANPVDLQQLPV